jgi:hypothetical protein
MTHKFVSQNKVADFDIDGYQFQVPTIDSLPLSELPIILGSLDKLKDSNDVIKWFRESFSTVFSKEVIDKVATFTTAQFMYFIQEWQNDSSFGTDTLPKSAG